MGHPGIEVYVFKWRHSFSRNNVWTGGKKDGLHLRELCADRTHASPAIGGWSGLPAGGS